MTAIRLQTEREELKDFIVDLLARKGAMHVEDIYRWVLIHFGERSCEPKVSRKDQFSGGPTFHHEVRLALLRIGKKYGDGRVERVKHAWYKATA